MAFTARNPRKARLIVTLAGLALALGGLLLWGTGDMHRGVAEQEVINASPADWNAILGDDYGPDDVDDYGDPKALGRRYAQWVNDATDRAIAEDHLRSAEREATLGIIILIAGLAVFGSRWLIKPAPQSAQGVNLTKEA